MARRTKQEAEATREGILLAALDLFSRKGYARTTFTDIADRIGMTRGAVYWHFDNKPALLAALIDHVHDRNKRMVGVWIPDIHTLEQMRTAFVAYARMVAEDAATRQFHFFTGFQMEWSEEMLTATHKKLNEIRSDPLDEFKKCFAVPAIAARLRPDADLGVAVRTLAAFWLAVCKLYLGRSPGIDFGQCADADLGLLGGFDLAEAAGAGFDLIMKGITA